MNIDFKKNGAQTADLTISISKSDYLQEFDTELKKQRQKASFKGFRKGKTPINYIKKLYGDHVLADIINKKAIDSVYEYLEENKINTILDPIIDENQTRQEITHKDLRDFEFTFKVALEPELEIKGVGASDEYTRFNVVPTDQELEENLEKIRTQAGERTTVEDSIEENDMTTLMADVLLEDEEGLTEPIEAEIKFLVSDTSESFQNQVKKLKLNDSIKVQMSEIENKDEDFIRKYYLRMEGDDKRTFNDEIDASITNVERMMPLDIGEALFEKIFPDEGIKTKAAALNRLREKTTEDHLNISNNLMYRTMMDKMMEQTTIDLSDEFLLKWAKLANVMKEGADEQEFLKFLKNDIKWNMIKGKLIKKFEIDVTQEEIIERAKEQVKGYFGYKVADADPYIDMIAQNILKDKEQTRKLADEVITTKMYKELEKEIKVNIEEKNVEDFYKLIDEINAKDKPKTEAEPQANQEIQEEKTEE